MVIRRLNRVKGIIYENRIRKELELKEKKWKGEDFKKKRKLNQSKMVR